MDALAEATHLISQNWYREARVLATTTPNGNLIARVIVGTNDEVDDVVLYNPSNDDIAEIQTLIAATTMSRARAAMQNPDAWDVSGIANI